MSQFQRRLGLLVAAIGVVVLASATYGFGAITADRVADIGTANDENALLSIDEVETGVVANAATSGEAAEVMTLTNTFESALDTIDVTIISVGDANVDPAHLSVTHPTELGTESPGNTGSVGLYCTSANGVQSDGATTVTLDIVGSGDGISVETTEEVAGVTVDCPSSGTSSNQ